MQVMVLEQKDINDIPFFLEKKLRKPPYQIQLSTARGSFHTCVRRVYVSNAAAHTDFLPIELNMCLSTRDSVSHADTFHMSSMYDESYSARWNAKRVAEREHRRSRIISPAAQRFGLLSTLAPLLGTLASLLSTLAPLQ